MESGLIHVFVEQFPAQQVEQWLVGTRCQKFTRLQEGVVVGEVAHICPGWTKGRFALLKEPGLAAEGHSPPDNAMRQNWLMNFHTSGVTHVFDWPASLG